jgi:hypothetical protein
MKPQSAKQKGRKLQQWVRDKLVEILNIHPENVKSTSMGAGGEDILMSKEARDAFAYSIECKCQESLNIWKAYDQACANSGEHEPLVIIKRNRSKTLAVVEAEYFINLHKD